jgi:hypothetical protein
MQAVSHSRLLTRPSSEQQMAENDGAAGLPDFERLCPARGILTAVALGMAMWATLVAALLLLGGLG